ncbi:MAG: CCA tRNA nucleotidyltransferase [Planctomycetota bacterium]|nr:MAG: CCA tRNA nucleotidyltransferase [Planctomycetota bacterium]
MNVEAHNDAGAWEAALRCMKKLRKAGFTALLAGGCVRDRLLNRIPKDYDVVTDAHPEQVRAIFPRARLVGAKFGVVIVRSRGHEIEVATFRADAAYSDGRRPDAVRFGTAEEDARRRDFTINGLFYDPFEDRLIDYVGGRADLQAGVIRTIGDPRERFAEDHLRMLRAVRFAARLGFHIEHRTWRAIEQLASHLARISAERIWMELALILTDPSRARGWELILDSGLRRYLAEPWTLQEGERETGVRRLAALPPRPVSEPLGLSAALGIRPTRETEAVARALRLSNELRRDTSWLVRSLPRALEPASLELADLKELRAHPRWDDLLELTRAELEARGTATGAYEELRRRAGEIPADRLCPPPLLTGDDLCAMGWKPGPALGEVLRALYRAQLNETIRTREEAVRLAESLRTDGRGK